MKNVKKQNKFVCAVFLAVLVFSLVGSIPLSAKADGWNWYKTEMVGHTSLADGRHDPLTLTQFYKNLGYNITFLTAHDIYTDASGEGMSFEEGFSSPSSNQAWTAANSTYGTVYTFANLLSATQAKSGTYSAHLALNATGTGWLYTRQYARTTSVVWEAIPYRSNIFLNFSIYPVAQGTAAGFRVGVFFQINSATGLSYVNETINLAGYYYLWFYTGNAAGTNSSNTYFFNLGTPTLNTWNDYSLNVTAYASFLNLSQAVPIRQLNFEADIYGTGLRYADAYFDQIFLYNKAPQKTQQQILAWQNGWIYDKNTAQFAAYPQIEITTYKHSLYFMNLTDASKIKVSSDFADTFEIIEYAHSQGLPVFFDHPDIIGKTAVDTIANNAYGTDLIEVKRGQSIADGYQVYFITTWDALLNKGYYITGIWDTDEHVTPIAGLPTTYVYAKSISVEDILKSLYEGRAYMASNNFVGRLIFNTKTSAEPYPSRYINYIADGDEATLYLNIDQGLTNGWKVCWVRNGTYFENSTITGSSFSASKSYSVPDTCDYWRVEVRDGSDNIIAMSEPIFFKKVSALPSGLYAQVSDFTTATGTNYTNNVQLGITAISYASDILTMTIDGKGISTTQVYCGSLGQPVTISPASADGGYDAGTGIQTLVWTHSSPQEFTLDWTPTGGGGGGGGGTTLYRLAVKVLRGSVPVPQASVSVGSDTSVTDSEGVATFNLRRGVYTVTVNFGNETQTKQVDLRSDVEVTFTLASGWSFPNIPSMDDGTMRTIVFVGVILLVMLFLIRKKKIK